MTIVRILFTVTILALACIVVIAAGAAQSEKATPPAGSAGTPDKVAAGRPYALELLLLIDTDKDNRVSKKEWMTFMEKEFDKLDTNHDGYIDLTDMQRTRLRVVHPYVGK